MLKSKTGTILTVLYILNCVYWAAQAFWYPSPDFNGIISFFSALPWSFLSIMLTQGNNTTIGIIIGSIINIFVIYYIGKWTEQLIHKQIKKDKTA